MWPTDASLAPPAQAGRPHSRRLGAPRLLMCLSLALLAPATAKGEGQNPGDKDWIDSPFTGNGVTPNGTMKVGGGVGRCCARVAGLLVFEKGQHMRRRAAGIAA